MAEISVVLIVVMEAFSGAEAHRDCGARVPEYEALLTHGEVVTCREVYLAPETALVPPFRPNPQLRPVARGDTP